MMSLCLNLFFQPVNAIANSPAISLQLRLAGSASANPSCKTRKRRVLAHYQTWEQILQLSEFYLDLSFPRLRSLSKDVENQLCAIEYLQIGGFRDRAHLGRL